MSSVSAVFGDSFADTPLKSSFLRWQCRVRQMMMRDRQGLPDDGIKPHVFLKGETEPYGQIITVLCKSPAYSLTPELNHMYSKTNDPAERRKQALQLFSATFYQKNKEFSDILTATFPPDSPGAAIIRKAEICTLVFEAYNQRFELACKIWKLADRNPLFAATIAQNRLFNPALTTDSVVLGFEPNWEKSSSSQG